jgi:hypothetical protein
MVNTKELPYVQQKLKQLVGTIERLDQQVYTMSKADLTHDKPASTTLRNANKQLQDALSMYKVFKSQETEILDSFESWKPKAVKPPLLIKEQDYAC